MGRIPNTMKDIWITNTIQSRGGGAGQRVRGPTDPTLTMNFEKWMNRVCGVKF